jgi:phosphatidylserine/phosphatidylglycerophosphate/cardiolipin synthase-like enzyme
MTHVTVPSLVLSLVDDLPLEHVLHMAALLEKEPDHNWPHLLFVLKAVVPQIDAQERVRLFVESWRTLPIPSTPHEMALLLQSVASALEHQRAKQKTELIWTGPKSNHTNLRRTDQALIELINTAQTKIIIVSYAVYKAKTILSALDKAAMRGVKIHVILESPDESEGKIAYDNIAALGVALRNHVRIFI